MILPKFTYAKPKSIDETIELYTRYEGRACYLAGGTDIIPLAKQRLVAPVIVIDLKNIEGLKAIEKNDDFLIIGANTTIFDLKKYPLTKEYFRGFYESLDETSCETLQMRGTIGGNILQNTRCLFYNKSIEWRTARGFCFKMGGAVCNAVPKGNICFSNYCSDNAVSLITLSAELGFVSPKGERRINIEKIFSGNGIKPFNLEPGEILTRIYIPMKKNSGAYEKIRVRGSIDYPLINVAVALKDSGGDVSIGGVGPAPLSYHIDSVDENSVEALAQKAYSDVKTVANTVLTPSYRKRMAKVLVKRAIKRALQEVK